MTLWDAMLSVLGGLGTFFGSPRMVIFYGILLLVTALVMFVIAGPASQDMGFYEDIPWWGVVIWWVAIVTAALFAISLFVWGASAGSPSSWTKP